MERGVENERGVMRPENYQGFPMEGLKFSEMGNNANRRALRDINNLTSGATYRPAVVKRSLNDVAPIDNKNTNSFAGRRPITRRFAASIARQSLDCPQNANTRLKPIGSERQKRSQPPVPNTTCIETCEAIDVDDIVSPNDVPLPMVEEIDVMIDCELKEVEMEDLEAKLLKDIDSCDSDNPLAVVDYVDDIYYLYRETEHLGCVPPDYMTHQFDINDRMRAILIDWLIEVHYKFELVDETLFLTVNIIDRFLARQSIVRKKLQLVGVTAMLLACKYEEVMVPVVEDLILISDRAYTRDEVLQMERLMINTLQFNMSVPTPYAFMRRFLKAAHDSDRRKIELLSSYIIELCLIEYEMLKFRPSMLAAAAVYTAQCSLNGFKHWSRTSELCTKYSEGQLFECSRMMVNFHHKAGKGKLTGVHRKYSTFKFGCAAKSEPALFMLDMRPKANTSG